MNARVPAPGRPIEIGLVNTMPDAALGATERQFRGLVAAAAGARPHRLRLYHLPQIARGEPARRHMARAGYESPDALPGEGLDALIVTGSEPRGPDLRAEPHWGALAKLVDWAQAHTTSAIWSCLAAHAAVLHLDGIARTPLPTKLSGVFPVASGTAHPLTQGAGPLSTPHSRWNTLAEAELQAAGYQVLTRSPAVGVDAFVREGASRFLMLQGHPEYDADSLRLEYRRDLRRFLEGETVRRPDLPRGVFAPDAEAALGALAAAGDRDMGAYAIHLGDRPETASWRTPWARIYANWFESLVAQVEGAAPRNDLRRPASQRPLSLSSGL